MYLLLIDQVLTTSFLPSFRLKLEQISTLMYIIFSNRRPILHLWLQHRIHQNMFLHFVHRNVIFQKYIKKITIQKDIIRKKSIIFLIIYNIKFIHSRILVISSTKKNLLLLKTSFCKAEINEAAREVTYELLLLK